MNNFLKRKTNQPFVDEIYYESLFKFFSRNIKLRNTSKNICWEKDNSPNNVRNNKCNLNKNLDL